MVKVVYPNDQSKIDVERHVVITQCIVYLQYHGLLAREHFGKTPIGLLSERRLHGKVVHLEVVFLNRGQMSDPES